MDNQSRQNCLSEDKKSYDRTNNNQFNFQSDYLTHISNNNERRKPSSVIGAKLDKSGVTIQEFHQDKGNNLIYLGDEGDPSYG